MARQDISHRTSLKNTTSFDYFTALNNTISVILGIVDTNPWQLKIDYAVVYNKKFPYCTVVISFTVSCHVLIASCASRSVSQSVS